MNKPRKRCELCNHWEAWLYGGRQDGLCKLHVGDENAGPDGCCVSDAMGYAGQIYTGKNFGCVKFKKK